MWMCSIARMSFHGDGDFLRVQRRIEGLVQIVREHQLQRVLARRQGPRRLGLALAEMPQLVGRRHRRIEFQLAEVHVDQQMVMTRVVEFDARRRDSHPFQSEAHGDRSLHRGAVLGRDEIHLGVGRGRDAVLRHGERRQQREAQREKYTIHCGSPPLLDRQPSYSCSTAYTNTPVRAMSSTTMYTTKSADALTRVRVQLPPKPR